MSSLSTEQLAELTERINDRLGEWEFPRNHSGIVEKLPRGVVRLVHDVIEEWWEGRTGPYPTTDPTPDDPLADGFHIGYQMARRKYATRMDGSDHTNGTLTVPDPTITAADYAEFEAAWPAIPDLQGEDVFAAEHGEPTGEPESENIPDTGLWAGSVNLPVDVAGQAFSGDDDDELPTMSFVHVAPEPVEPPQIIAPLPDPVRVPVLSPQAAATLGPEHTEVSPLKPRTLAEVDADEKRFAQLGSDEKAAQLRAIVNELRMLSAHGEMPSMAEWDEQKPDDLPRAAAITQRHKLSWGRLAEYADLRFDLNERKARRHSRESIEGVAA